MVSSCTRNSKSKFSNYCNKTEDLSAWIRKVRSKKVTIKRATRGQDLRVLVVLSQALKKAERDLRQKQEERAQKWARIKSQLSEPKSLTDEEEAEQKRQIENLWSSELNGLNDFMKSLHQIKATS
jgi:hypothetical protein